MSDRPRVPARARWVTAALASVPAAFLAVFFILPFGTIVWTGLGGEGDGLVATLTRPSVRSVLWFTTWQAAASTALTVAIGLPVAWLLARVRLPGMAVLRAAVVVPFVMPTVVVGLAFLRVLQPGAPLARMLGLVGFDETRLSQSVTAIVLAHVFFNVAIVARTVGAAWATLDPATEDAARMLGARPIRILATVTLPRLRAAIGAASVLVFVFCFTSFGVVKILGGPRIATIEVEIHRVTTQLLDLRTAAILSMLQLTVVVAVLSIHGRAGGADLGSLVVTDRARRPRGVAGWTAAVSAITIVGVLLIPIGILIHGSFDTADGYGLAFYRDLDEARRGTNLFVSAGEATWHSLRFAAAATTMAIVVGGTAAIALRRLPRRTRAWFDRAVMLPLGASAVTVGFGFLVGLDDPPVDLRTSWVIVPAAQALLAVPIVLRVLVPALDAIDQRYREAAALLGASPRRILRTIDFPLIGRSLAVAAGFAAALSLGEFGATVFIARPDIPTLPVALFRALGQPGATSLGRALAFGTILSAVTVLLIVITDRVGRDIGTIGRRRPAAGPTHTENR